MAQTSSSLDFQCTRAIAVLAGVVGVCLPGSFYLIRHGWDQPLRLAGVLAPLLSAGFTWLLMGSRRQLHPIVLPLSLWCVTATAADALPFASAGHELALVTAALAYIAYQQKRKRFARAATLMLGVVLACLQAQVLIEQRTRALQSPSVQRARPGGADSADSVDGQSRHHRHVVPAPKIKETLLGAPLAERARNSGTESRESLKGAGAH